MLTDDQLRELGIDPTDVMERFGGDAALLMRILPLFLTDNTTEAMVAAFANQNAAELERASHSLKGSAANVGLTTLSQLAARVCEATRSANGAMIDFALIDETVQEYQRVCEAARGFGLNVPE